MIKSPIEEMTMNVNTEIKKVVSRVKTAQAQLQTLVKSQDWVDEARKYADRQRREVRKLLNGDVTLVKNFLERERKELEKIQKRIPGEVDKFRKFVKVQRKELEKLLQTVRKASANGNGRAKTRSTGKKKAGGAKKRGSASSTTSAAPAAQA